MTLRRFHLIETTSASVEVEQAARIPVVEINDVTGDISMAGKTVQFADQIFRATVTLTNAQILTLPTAGVQIVPAPGVNKLLLLHRGYIRLKWTTAYGNVNGGGIDGTNFQLCYQNSSLASSNYIDPASDMVQPMGDQGWGLTPNANLMIADELLLEQKISIPVTDNQPLKLFGSNTGGNFTLGGAGNSLQVVVYYSVEDTPGVN